jgi:hypothetical protein
MATGLKPEDRIVAFRDLPAESPVAGYTARIIQTYNPRTNVTYDFQAEITTADGRRAKGAIYGRIEQAQVDLDEFFQDLIETAAAAADQDAQAVEVFANTVIEPGEVPPARPQPRLITDSASALQVTMSILFSAKQRAALDGDWERVLYLELREQGVWSLWKRQVRWEARPQAA